MGPVRDPPDHPPQPMSAHCAATSVGWRDSFLPDTSPCRATGSCGKLVQTASLLEDLDGGPQWPGGPRSGPLSLRRLAAPACQRPAWQRQPSQAGGSQMTPGKCDGPDPQPGILRWCPALGWCQCPTIPIATPRLILGRRCRNSCVRLQTRNGLTCTGWGGDGSIGSRRLRGQLHWSGTADALDRPGVLPEDSESRGAQVRAAVIRQNGLRPSEPRWQVIPSGPSLDRVPFKPQGADVGS